MRVSQNEVYRATQRALEGAGAGYGSDRDGAYAVSWLEGRGLPGLAMLAAALDHLDGAFAPLAPPHPRDGIACIDLGGRPAIAWAGAMPDCLQLQDRQDRRGRLTVRQCRWPLFLLPEAARRAAHGRPVCLRWPAGGVRLICIGDANAGCRIVAEGGACDLTGAFLDDGPVDLVMESGDGGVRAADRDGPATVRDAEALDAALRRSLAEGIVVADDVWARVAAAAKRVLVPASAESRVRGAGGGDANA